MTEAGFVFFPTSWATAPGLSQRIVLLNSSKTSYSILSKQCLWAHIYSHIGFLLTCIAYNLYSQQIKNERCDFKELSPRSELSSLLILGLRWGNIGNDEKMYQLSVPGSSGHFSSKEDLLLLVYLLKFHLHEERIALYFQFL